MNNAVNITFDELCEGSTRSHDYIIDEGVYRGFLNVFHDESPIHIDDKAAHAAGFRECVMHGSILNGFISHFIGMIFPGERALLLRVDLRYATPSYLNDRLRVTGTVVHKTEAQSVIEINVRIENLTQRSVAATGKILVKVRAT